MDKSSSTFCMYPFSHINVKLPDVSVAQCFRQPNLIHNVESFEVAFNDTIFKDIRKSALSGKKHPACNQCWEHEASGAISYRVKSLSDITEITEKEEQVILDTYNKETGTLDFTKVPFIELRVNRQCQLMCRHCSTGQSSRWGTEIYKEKNKPLLNFVEQHADQSSHEDPSQWSSSKEYKDTITDLVLKTRKNLRHVMFSGGEPLITRLHYEVLEMLSPYASNIALEYSTNFNLINFKNYNLIELWKPFKHVKIGISIDGDPYMHDYFRYKGSIDKIIKNVEVIQQSILSNVEFTMTLTTNLYNILRVPEAFQFYTDMTCNIDSSIVTEPNYLDIRNLPQNLKDSVNMKINNASLNFNSKWDLIPAWTKQFQIDSWYAHLKSVQNYMNSAEPDLNLWKRFLEYTQLFDNMAGMNILDLYPEFKNYM